MTVKSLTEGLTQAQKEKAVKLLEGVEVEELASRWSKIRDIVIEDRSAAKPVVKPAVAPAVKLEEKKVVAVAPVVAPASTPIADNAVINHQIKKVLNEGEVKDGKASASQPKANDAITGWANRIKPKYENG